MQAARLRWIRGRSEPGGGEGRTLEWIGINDAGEAVARIVRIGGAIDGASRCRPRPDGEAEVVELHPAAPAGVGWLALVRGCVVGRAALPMEAMRAAEAAMADGWAVP